MWREGLMLGTLAACWTQAPLANPAMLEGSYTEAQAAEGKRAYDQYCTECHHPTLRGTGHNLELAGPNFLAKWGGQTTAELFDDIGTRMPPQAAGSLTAQTCAAITAHVLCVNGATAGDKALGADAALIIGRAVPTGMGVFKLMTARQSPDIYQPQGGNALYVFERGD